MFRAESMEACDDISKYLEGVMGLPDGLVSLNSYFEQFGVTPEGQRIVLDTFKAPNRRGGSGRYNTSMIFASRKMKRGIQAESRTCEGPFVEMCEQDSDIVFYLCQPARIYVRQTDLIGRTSLRPRGFDFLLLNVSEDANESGFWLVECKRQEELEKESAKPSANYRRDGSGWRFPAAEEAAERLGLRFRLFSSDEIDTCWCMNMQYLTDFVDVPCPDSGLAESLMAWLSEVKSLRIQQVLSLPGMKSEVVWWLIANNELWADLSQELVTDTDTSSIHVSQAVMLANRHLREPLAEVATSHKIRAVRVEPGFPVRWDGEPFVILHRGKKEVTLRYSDGEKRIVPLSLDDFWRLVHEGSICGDEDSAAAEILAAREALVRNASEEELKRAEWRYEVLREYRETGIVPAGSSKRSVDRYGQEAREGEQLYGNEFFGLIRLQGRPRGTPDLDGQREAVLTEMVEKYGDNRGGAGCSVIYRELLARCKKLCIDPPPSYWTLWRRLKECRLPDLVEKREGWRAAYQVRGPVRKLGDVPATPLRAFQTGHLDHTPLSVKVVSRFTGKVLETRVNLTFMVDAYSGMPLAMYTSFDHPSKVAVCEILHDCIARHGRLPDNIVVDKGKEFGSADWEKALVRLRVNKIQRPAASPRVGSPIERHFGINDSEFIHALPGSMKLAKAGRNQTSTHAPAKYASLTFAQLQEGCERWFFEVFPELVHGELGATRRGAFEHSLEKSGERLSRHVPLDDGLRMLLALSVEGGTRKVHPVRGIRVKWLDYWNDLFSYGDVAGSNVVVKIDPLDVSVAFAWVRGTWVTCRLSNGRAYLQGRSWKLVNLAIQELREQRRTGARLRWVNAARIAELIEEMTGQDNAVGRQAELDRESKDGADVKPAVKGGRHLRLVKGKVDDLESLGEAGRVELGSIPDHDDGLAGVEPCDVIR